MKNNDLSVIKKVMQLQDMNMRELTKTRRTLFDHEPDATSQRYMIEKSAYRIQGFAYGGPDNESDGKIKACAKEITKKNAASVSKKPHKFCPMIGTKIVKEYKGKTHEVMVVNDGFSYDGTVFRSLLAIAAKIAAKIAGTKWNGLKFFGVGA